MLSGLRILVVDDFPAVRHALRVFLELEGARVSVAGSAREAVELSRTSTFDIVLTDLSLPDVPGDTVITHFRALSRRRTPVAVLSGADEPELARAAWLGADRVFKKPLEWDELVDYLERRRILVIDEADVSESPENPMTIVIVEDDAAMRALLQDVLERAGHRVIALADGTRLAVIAEHEEFDAVILDKEMPGPNGLDLLSFLRHRRPDVPVIFVTAFGGAEVADEAARRGAYSYIEKPFRVDAILDAIEAVPRYRIGLDAHGRARDRA